MLGIDRTAARYTWTAAAVLLLLALIYQVRSTLFVFTLAVLFAYLLSPAVDLLDRALPTRARTLALALVYVVFVGVVVLAVSQIGSRVVVQARTLAGKFPAMIAAWQRQSTPATDASSSLQAQILDNIRAGITQKTNELIGALPDAGLKFLSAASNIIYVVIVPVLAFFFIKDGEVIRSHILDLADSGPFTRGLLEGLIEDIHALLAKYMRALVVLSLSTFTAYGTFFTIMGVPYGILLAVLAMVLEFIPMIGPLAAAAVILIVAAVAGEHLLAVLIFIVAFRMFQDYVLSPHVMGQGVQLHPLLVLFGVFGGAELAGVPGSFLSVPVLALARILYLRMRRQRVAQ
jgi:predicted PurR-regulated permease PerM